MRKKESDLSVIVKVKDLGSYIFTVIDKSLKKFRFTFVSRIQNLKLRTSNKKRLKRKLKRYCHAYRNGVMDMEAVSRSLASCRRHLSYGNTYYLQKNIVNHLILSKQTKEEREEHERKIKEQIK